MSASLHYRSEGLNQGSSRQNSAAGSARSGCKGDRAAASKASDRLRALRRQYLSPFVCDLLERLD
ncbi:MAG: hypothetical protein IT514_07425 [Burkholderiales bacterium]|nr:hypothetical protein [Burkholderiales bacterium]